MCGRYHYSEQESVEIEKIVKDVAKKLGPTHQIKTGEVYPADEAVVMVLENGQMVPTAIKWGFPRWNGGGVVINARSETALEKNMFRRSVLERRCVIPSTGFYEWQRIGGKKQKEKYLLRRPGEKELYMAGMWDLFKLADHTEYAAFVILTTAANESVASIHDRMPVILSPEERKPWLKDESFTEFVLHRPGPALSSTLVSA